MKKSIFALALVFVMVIALCACDGDTPGGTGNGGNGSTGGKTYGGEIVVGLTADLDASLDPHVSSSSAGTREILFNIYEGLIKPDSDGNLIPAIAERYEVNETADVYTFTLRQGVRFHNGKTVEVGDVVYSLSRAAGLETGEPLVSDVKGIKAVEATDDKTVVVTLSAPDTEFLAHAIVSIIPADSDPLTEVIGTGPFKYVSRTVQDNIKLEKFADYWGEPAYADTITLKVISDSRTMVMSLQSGAIDIAVRMQASQVDELPGLTVLEGSGNAVQAMYLNNAVAPFDDVRVRQALCYAIDKNQIIALANGGYGTPVGSSMFPAFGKYYIPELADYYEPSVEKAKELLAQAGYPDGFEFTITVPSNYQQHIDVAQVIVELLRPVGVTAHINQVEWSTWLKETYQGRDFEATIVSLDAHGIAASDMLARFQSGHGKNFINFSNEEYDKTYLEAVSTTDDAIQTERFKRCETILTEQAANVYVQDLASFVVMQNDIGGYEFYPLYVFDLAKLYRTDQGESK